MWIMYRGIPLIPNLLCGKLTSAFWAQRLPALFLWNNIFFAERMDFAISGILACVSGYSSRVARNRLKPGTRGLTFLSCADHSCRRKKQRRQGRTKAWKKLRDLEGNYNTKQTAGNPLPFRAEGEPPVSWLVHFVFWDKQQTSLFRCNTK